MLPKIFVLDRKVDVSGVSGVGVVATGVQFPDGTCVLKWEGAPGGLGVYSNVDEVLMVHGHQGNTQLVWVGREAQKNLEFAEHYGRELKL